MAECNLSTLIDQACENGFRCLDERTFRGVLLQLLCDFQESGGGGGGDLPAGTLVYRALLTQSGTDAPVATVLQNTLGGTIVWSYVSPGTYFGTLVGAFPINKVFSMAGQRASAFIEVARNNNDSVFIQTTAPQGVSPVQSFDPSDGILDGKSVEILVFP